MNNITCAGLFYVNQQEKDALNSTESTSWGDMRPLINSPLVSDYEGCYQDACFDDEYVLWNDSNAITLL